MMLKLVAIGGKLRGKEFVLEEGENSFGRGAEAKFQVQLDGISKKHMNISVNNDVAYLADLGSSNGTFVNGKITKQMSLKEGDKVAMPNIIFQLVKVQEKKVVVKKKVAKVDQTNNEEIDEEDIPPNSPVGKIIFMFKKKIMPIIHGFNEQYEWRVMLGILFFIFIVINITLIIFPVLSDSKKLLTYEIAARGSQYAKEVARYNAVALYRRDLDRIDTSFLENDADGVQSYELFDLDGIVYRPLGKQNSISNDSFSVDAKMFFKGEENLSKSFIKKVGDGEIGIARAITAYDAKTGRQEPVGIIALRFKPKTLVAEAANSSKAYLESLVTSLLVAILFYGMFYYLTTKPLDELKKQIEDVLRGKKGSLESKLQMEEIYPLRNSINSILTRIKELTNTDSGESREMEDEAPYVRTLQEFARGAQGPVLILNSEKKIKNINPEAEDLLGIRENASIDSSLLDTARDQGFAATLIDLCDKSASNDGCNQSEVYELQGKSYNINVSSLMGRDKFAKCFYVTFVSDK